MDGVKVVIPAYEDGYFCSEIYYNDKGTAGKVMKLCY